MIKRLGIRVKLLSVYLVMTVAFAILLVYGLEHLYQERVRDIYKDKEDFARIAATSLTSLISGVSGTMSASGDAIIRAKMPPESINQYLSFVDDSQATICCITYVDTTGTVVASSNTETVGSNLSAKPYIKQVIGGQDLVVGGYEQHADGEYGFTIATALRQNGNLNAILLAFIDEHALKSVIPPLKTGCCNIVDANGTLVFQSQHQDIPLSLRDWGKLEPIKLALDGKISHSDDFVCPRDKKRHFNVEIPVSQLGWAVGAGVEIDEALAHIYEDMIRAIPFYAIVFIIASAMILYIGQSISQPIMQLSKNARLIGEGKLDEPVEVATNDEISMLAGELDGARKKLQESFRSIGLLLEASSALNSSLDITRVVSALSAVLTELLGVGKIAIAAYNKKTDEILVLDAVETSQVKPGERYGLSSLPPIYRKLFQEKVPMTMAVDDPALDDGSRAFIEACNIKNALLHPLLIGNRMIGCMMLTKPDAGGFNENELRLINAISAQAAVAIDNARLYEKEHKIAETLQQALMTVSPELPGLEIVYVYETALGASRVGGDFFDIFELEDGKIGFVIGDVSGKGIEAATYTVIAKSIIRAFAYKGLNTAEVMKEANAALDRQMSRSHFVTAIFGILDTQSGLFEVTNAGHPDLVLCRQDRCELYKTPGNPMLGAFPNIKYEESYGQLEQGGMIVLYTDGLIEARTNGVLFGEQRLVDTINHTLPAPSKAILKTLVKSASAFAGGNLRDDMAIICLRRKLDSRA